MKTKVERNLLFIYLNKSGRICLETRGGEVRAACFDGDEIGREWRVNCIIDGVQEMERFREGVAILLNYVWHSAMVDFGCASSKVLWIKFKFSRVKFVWWWWCMVPMKERVKERTDSGMTWTGLRIK